MWIVKRKKSNKKKKKGNSINSVYFFQDMTGDMLQVVAEQSQIRNLKSEIKDTA